MKQTAVEFLKQNLPSLFLDDSGHYANLFEQAKEMEKQQMKDVLFEKVLRPFQFNFEQYYNETYGSKIGTSLEWNGEVTQGSKESNEYPTLEGTINLCNDIIKKKTGKMTEEEWQAVERAQTSTPIDKEEQKGILVELMELDSKDGLYRASPQSEISDEDEYNVDEYVEGTNEDGLLDEMLEQPMRFHCVPKEISDEEIEKEANKYIVNAYIYYFQEGAKWYREQLKKK